ncbi:MAG: hypothetical protein ACP5RQ_00755 [Candidatus Micrarchaeia archaeon]
MADLNNSKNTSWSLLLLKRGETETYSANTPSVLTINHTSSSNTSTFNFIINKNPPIELPNNNNFKVTINPTTNNYASINNSSYYKEINASNNECISVNNKNCHILPKSVIPKNMIVYFTTDITNIPKIVYNISLNENTENTTSINNSSHSYYKTYKKDESQIKNLKIFSEREKGKKDENQIISFTIGKFAFYMLLKFVPNKKKQR